MKVEGILKTNQGLHFKSDRGCRHCGKSRKLKAMEINIVPLIVLTKEADSGFCYMSKWELVEKLKNAETAFKDFDYRVEFFCLSCDVPSSYIWSYEEKKDDRGYEEFDLWEKHMISTFIAKGTSMLTNYQRF